MIDIQTIAGRRPELLLESVRRILQLDRIINHVYIANNTGYPIKLQHDKVTVLDNVQPLTFEKNHNNLAKLGNSEYILFLDDDAFIFTGNIELMLEKLMSDCSLLLVGYVNNQTWRPTNQEVVPKVASLEYFFANERSLSEVSIAQKIKYGSHGDVRLFCPGNLMLTRRKTWQDQYNGWDESYCNWNEEIDYILWGYERGMKTLVLPGVWFFHGMSSSRRKSQLLDNIVESSCHFLQKFPLERIDKISEQLEPLSKVYSEI